MNGVELPRSTHQGEVKIGEVVLDCYVLSNERRVISKRGMAKIMGFKSKGGNVFVRTMNTKSVGSILSPELKEKIENPIFFKSAYGEMTHGYEATILVEIVNAIVEAQNSGLLARTQQEIANEAQILKSAFAKVGVNSLIDEVTGYQQLRDPLALRFMVEQYIEEEKRLWQKEFPDDFYNLLHKIYGSKSHVVNKTGNLMSNRPQHFAKFTRKYIYEPLENGKVLEELDRVNPTIDEKWTRKDKFHQHLTQGYGVEKLRIQVREVITLLILSKNIEEFDKLFQKRFKNGAWENELK